MAGAEATTVIRRWVANHVVGSPLVPYPVRWRLLRLLGMPLEPCALGHGVYFGGFDVRIGAGSGINMGTVLDNLGPIRIGRMVSIGHQAMLLTSSHEHGVEEIAAGRAVGLPIVIEDGAWIGARAIILPGVTVGAGATVAAGAVVTKDCLPGGIYAGVPARLVRQRVPEQGCGGAVVAPAPRHGDRGTVPATG
jgi:maltose O-acetyltransferase